MPSIRSLVGALLGVVGVALLAAPAAAQRVDYVGRVTAAHRSQLPRRPVGDPRYVALSSLLYEGDQVSGQVLDLVSMKLGSVSTSRAGLARRFGRQDAQLGAAIPPEAQIALYTPARAGLFLKQHGVGAAPRRHWYAEVDARGVIGRTADLGVAYAEEYLEFAGTDLAGGNAWWILLGKQQAVLRRMDLQTLDVTDVVSVPLAVRTSNVGYEELRFIHAARDFSRFAIVDYYEDGIKLDPGEIHVIDPLKRSWFAIDAPSTAYGLAFSVDGKFMYLGSAQHGTVMRVDLANRVIDRKIAGPVFQHHLVLSPDGKRLYALASSKRYSVFDLELSSRKDLAHPAEVAPAMQELFGGGVSTRDGYFVVDGPGASGEYVVARLR